MARDRDYRRRGRPGTSNRAALRCLASASRRPGPSTAGSTPTPRRGAGGRTRTARRRGPHKRRGFALDKAARQDQPPNPEAIAVLCGIIGAIRYLLRYGALVGMHESTASFMSTTLKRTRRGQNDRRPRQWLPQHHRWQTLRWSGRACRGLARAASVEVLQMCSRVPWPERKHQRPTQASKRTAGPIRKKVVTPSQFGLRAHSGPSCRARVACGALMPRPFPINREYQTARSKWWLFWRLFYCFTSPLS